MEARVFQKQRMTHRLQRNIAGLGMFSLSAFNSCKVTTVAYIYLEIEEVGEARFTGINIPKFALNSSIPHEHAMFFFSWIYSTVLLSILLLRFIDQGRVGQTFPSLLCSHHWFFKACKTKASFFTR